LNLVPNATLIFQMVLFLVLMVILDRVLFKPMLRVIEERKARTEGRRKAAAQADAEAGSIWESYQKKIAEARAGAEVTRMEVIRKAEGEAAKISETATHESEKTLAEMRARVRADADSAKAAVKGEVEAMARSMAEKILGRAV